MARDGGRRWRRAQRKVEARSGGRCEIGVPNVCAGHGDQVHHVRLRSHGGTDDPSNLLWTCEPCHRFVHEHSRWAREHGYLVTRRDRV